MRFVFNDPHTLRFAIEQLANPPAQQRDQPIPVDVYREGNDIVIEGALPGARLQDLDLTSEEGLLTVRGVIAPVDRDYAVQEIPYGVFSRTLALPPECDASQAKATFENGIVRIVIPRQQQRPAHSVKVEMGSADQSARIVMEKPDVIDAVKGDGYRDVQPNDSKAVPPKDPKRRGRIK